MEKIIHRIYFGFDGKPDPYLDYLNTWQEQLPEFKIMFWDANNLPMDCCQFVREMHKLKDHAFLSDYFRWWCLREFGGVYFDADVEVTDGNKFRTIFNSVNSDSLLQGAIGIDNREGGWYTAHSMIMKKGSDITKFICSVYEGLGYFSIWRRKIFYLMAPQITALYFDYNGYNSNTMGSSPNLECPCSVCGVKIYPQDYFSPLTPGPNNTFVLNSVTENTCLCHHFSCSWHDDDSIYKKESLKHQRLLAELIAQQRANDGPKINNQNRTGSVQGFSIRKKLQGTLIWDLLRILKRTLLDIKSVTKEHLKKNSNVLNDSSKWCVFENSNRSKEIFFNTVSMYGNRGIARISRQLFDFFDRELKRGQGGG